MAPVIVGGSGFPIPAPFKGGAGKSGTGQRNPNCPKNGNSGKTGNTAPEPRTASHWLLHWLTRDPTITRYQEPVPLARVLGEHHGAVAAEPCEEGALSEEYARA